MIYTSKRDWGLLGNPTGFERYPVWIEQYDAPRVPPPRGDGQWTFQQYRGDTQDRLIAAGGSIESDCDFGPATAAAVQTFQALRNLAQDGVVGPMTFAQLRWP